jgi:hypothetical protein
MSRFSYILNA